MDRLRFKCRERGGPITLIGEIGDKSAVLLKFSPIGRVDHVFDIDSIDAAILGEPQTPEGDFAETAAEEDEKDDG